MSKHLHLRLISLRMVEVERVMMHMPNDKSLGWDGLTNEFFKHYVLKLKGPLACLFQQVWSYSYMSSSWIIGLIKLLPKLPSPTSFRQWKPISLMGGLYKVFRKVIAGRLQKVLPKIVHKSQYGFI